MCAYDAMTPLQHLQHLVSKFGLDSCGQLF